MHLSQVFKKTQRHVHYQPLTLILKKQNKNITTAPMPLMLMIISPYI